MDPEDINILLYYSLLQADPPDNELIPTSSLVPDTSSASSSTLTFVKGLQRVLPKRELL